MAYSSSKSKTSAPEKKASISYWSKDKCNCPVCKKPFIVKDAVIMSEAQLLALKRVKCPFCGKEQERNKFGCIFCHKAIPS